MAYALPKEAVKVLDQLFPFAVKQLAGTHGDQMLQLGQALQVAALVGVVDKVPSELIVLEAEDLAAFSASVEVLRNALAMWQGPKGHVVTYIQGFGKLNPVALIRRALAKCPNEVVPVGTDELPLLNGEPELRNALRLDLARAERAFLNGDWKAPTVLSGSVLEALLFWALDQPKYQSQALNATKAPKEKGGSGKPLDEWSLSGYIAVAEEIALLTTPNTITEAKLTQDYRNLIHPGRQARLGQQCDKGTAQIAAAATGHVAADIAIKFP